MKELLPLRTFSALIATPGVIVIFPKLLLADALIPWFMLVQVSLVVLLIPVILIESVVLQSRLGLGWPRALGVSALANVASAVAGIVALGVIEATSLPFNITGTGALAPFLILLLLLFFVSWLIEYFIAGWWLRPARSPSVLASSQPAAVSSVSSAPGSAKRPFADLIQVMLEANVYSYLFLAVVSGYFIANNHPRGGNGQASAVGSLYTLNRSEVTYSSTYTTGFSATLADLDGTANPSTAESAGLIDSILGSGVKSAYRFTYTPGPGEKAPFTSYSITASPINGPGSGNFYYTDQSGVIRMNNTAPAGSTDSPLAG